MQEAGCMSKNQDNSESIDLDVVDVVIANRDGMPFLPAAVQSVLNQTISALRVHVVDGESQDGSSDYLASITDPRFSWSSSPYRLTPAARRNLGMARTSADYVMFLDSDDVLVAEAVSNLKQALTSPEYEIAVGGIRRFFDAEVEPLRTPPESSLRGEVEYAPAIGNVLFKRSLMDRIGQFDENLLVGDFVEWMSRLRALHTTEQKVPNLVVWRREHSRNWSRVTRDHYARDYPAIVRSYLHLRKQSPK